MLVELYYSFQGLATAAQQFLKLHRWQAWHNSNICYCRAIMHYSIALQRKCTAVCYTTTNGKCSWLHHRQNKPLQFVFAYVLNSWGSRKSSYFFMKQQKIEQGPGGKWSSKGGSRSPQFGEKRGKNVLALIL